MTETAREFAGRMTERFLSGTRKVMIANYEEFETTLHREIASRDAAVRREAMAEAAGIVRELRRDRIFLDYAAEIERRAHRPAAPERDK